MAAGALGRIRDDRAVEPLINALEDEWIQGDVTAILKKGGFEQADQQLDHVMESEWIQEDIAYALLNILDFPAVKHLVQALSDRNRNIQKIIGEAVQRQLLLRWAREVWPLVQHIEAENRKVEQVLNDLLAKIKAEIRQKREPGLSVG